MFKMVFFMAVFEVVFKPQNNLLQVFAFKINICTFATPLLGMECLIKIILWTH